MKKPLKPKKDQYGNYVSKEEFEKYWDDYHKLEDLSMKESKRQKEERIKKLNRNI
tara:strand:- start:340 stop:504 length:165 start_codon:yes stop_codon:yes gene_type:complete